MRETVWWLLSRQTPPRKAVMKGLSMIRHVRPSSEAVAHSATDIVTRQYESELSTQFGASGGGAGGCGGGEGGGGGRSGGGDDGGYV